MDLIPDLEKTFFKVPKPSNKIVTAKEVLIKPYKDNDPNHIFTKNSQQVIERLKYIKPGQSAFTAKLPKSLTLNVKGAKISQIYRRLNPNKPAYTVTGSGGGGTYVPLVQKNRALTNRERARLQTFPDDFILKVIKRANENKLEWLYLLMEQK